MKHEASRRKTVSPLPRKSFNQPKIVGKKAVSSTAGKSGKQISIKTVKTAVAKSVPVVSTRNLKPKASAQKKEVINKLSKVTVSNGKKNAAVSKPVSVAGKQKTVKSAPKIIAKTVSVKVQKAKPNIAVKKIRAVKINALKIKPKVAARVEKPKVQKTAPKVIAKKSVKTVMPVKVKTLKIQISKSKTQTVKVADAKLQKAAKAGSVVKKSKQPTAVISSKRAIANVPKAKLTTTKTTSKKVAEKPLQAKPTSQVKEVVEKSRQAKSLISAEKSTQSSKRAKPIAAKITPPSKTKKLKETVVPIVSKPNPPKTKVATPVKTLPLKRVEAVEPRIEAATLPLPKPKKKKVKPIGTAIFRGKKERYDFQVFPVDGEFEDAAAIFIISKRKVDKRKKAHHKMVCIGQTTSVLSELKKHRKGKCFKKYEANAISVLREENEQKRQKIESDLKSAHTIPCPHA